MTFISIIRLLFTSVAALWVLILRTTASPNSYTQLFTLWTMLPPLFVLPFLNTTFNTCNVLMIQIYHLLYLPVNPVTIKINVTTYFLSLPSIAQNCLSSALCKFPTDTIESFSPEAPYHSFLSRLPPSYSVFFLFYLFLPFFLPSTYTVD